MSKHNYNSNKAYKKQLDRKGDLQLGWKPFVCWLTDEPDWAIECKLMAKDPWYKGPEPNYRGKYVYYERPSVPYTVMRIYSCNWGKATKKFYKRQCNRSIRRELKNYNDIIYQYGDYRRAREYQWEID